MTEESTEGVVMRDRKAEPRLQKFESEALTHLDTLLRAANRLGRDFQDGEDIVQETYLRAWKYFDSFDSGTNCRAWLFGIMFNVIRARRGKQAKRPEIPLMEDESAEYQRSNVLTFDPLKQIEGREVLEAASKLSEDHRAVLGLIVVEEFSYQEAATVLEVPVGTVMSRLHRARLELRRRLITARADEASS